MTAAWLDTLKANLRQGGIFIAFVAIVTLALGKQSPSRRATGRTSSCSTRILIPAIGMLFVIVLAQTIFRRSWSYAIWCTQRSSRQCYLVRHRRPRHGHLDRSFQRLRVSPGFIVTLAALLFRGLTDQTDNFASFPYTISPMALNGLLQRLRRFTLVIRHRRWLFHSSALRRARISA